MTGITALRSKALNKQWWKRFLSTLRYALYTMVHPFDGFWDLTHEKRGSVAAANFIVAMLLAGRLAYLRYASFLFNIEYWPTINIIEQCMSLLMPLCIWCVCNWGLTTLFDGKGTLRDVYMATAYALVPLVLSQWLSIPVSNLVTETERVFMTVISAVGALWSGMLAICGMMMIHDYSLKKVLLFTLMTVLSMMIVIFVILLFTTLVGDGVGYFASLYREIVFRLN